MEAEFQYTLSNIDMKELYNNIICSDLDCPEVILVEEIEDGSNIMRKKMTNGNHLIYIKNDENIFDTLQKELVKEKANVVTALPFENHNLTNEELMIWISCACEIANLLKVRCPQLIFTPFEDAANASGEGLLCLPDKKPYGKLNVIEMFVCIAHELRHEWQHVKHPDWSEGYVHVESEEDMEAYLNHRTEIDAEAYARKLAEKVFGFRLFAGGKTDFMKKLRRRANEIDIIISEDTIEYFRALFDVDEWE